MLGIKLRVKGKVQGVGFRPFVWQLAHQLQLLGDVLNDGEGVLIRLVANANIEQFKQLLIEQLPPLAQVNSMHCSEFQWQVNEIPLEFCIAPSQPSQMDTQVVPDAATCPECLHELLSDRLLSGNLLNNKDVRDRRYHYPFINCTHCGPRFTIIEALPYDRPKTVMRDFPMCSECSQEYQLPSDRRYHAQPIACPVCGPLAQAVLPDGSIVSEDWLTVTIDALTAGKTVVIKSVGGFHLLCDATNADAVQKLRDRKQRQFKPFAIMVDTVDTARNLAQISTSQLKMLTSSIAPIVLLPQKQPSILAENIAPKLNELGIMLPSNPLQHLIAHHFRKPVVMTSANRTSLPPAIDNAQALRELHDLADLFIMHNRTIVQRCDDSLIRMGAQGQQETLRRSRGLVPDAINLPKGFPNATGFLACGGDLKNAIALGKNNQVIVSQYLGDLTNIETQQQYQQAIQHFTSLYGVEIDHYVADRHPGYFSHQFAQSTNQTVALVQHHHAHIAACLVENQWAVDNGSVLALALDGLGLGDDGTFWGAELMIADYQHCQRIGGIPAIELVGGDKAAKEPWRSYYAHLNTFCPEIDDSDKPQRLLKKPLTMLKIAQQKGLNCHNVRSAGRLFDAVAASLDIAFDSIEYEGLAACQLEALAQRCQNKQAIEPIVISHRNLELNLGDFWRAFLTHNGCREEKAYLFHLSLANALANLVLDAQCQYPQLQHLVLTGGVFHNALLTQLLKTALQGKLNLLQHQQFSCGDGSLALGQIAVALIQNQPITTQ